MKLSANLTKYRLACTVNPLDVCFYTEQIFYVSWFMIKMSLGSHEITLCKCKPLALGFNCMKVGDKEAAKISRVPY